MAKRKKQLEPLTPKQRQIMEVVWELGEASAFEVRDELSKYRPVARNTIRTTMERLEEKGWLTHRVSGRTFFYSALVEKEVSIGQRIVEVVDQVCGGDPEHMMSALLDYRGLSADEIKRVEELLAQAKKENSKRKKR